MPVGAVIVGGATLGAAAITANSASRATRAATNAQNQNIQLANQTRDANVALSQPTVDRGNQAADSIQHLLGLSGDHAAQDAAFHDFLNGTQYQFQVGEGMRAINANRATAGLLNSGDTLRRLTAFGEDMGRGAITDYLGQLGTVANRGLTAIGAVTGANDNRAAAITNANNATADAIGNGAIAQGNAWSGALGQLASLASFGFGQSSYGGGGAAAAAKKTAGAGAGAGGGAGYNPLGVFAI